MPVAPLELNTVTADRLDRHGVDVRVLGTAVLPLADGAATVLTEVAGSVHSLVPVAPADPYVPLVGARDCHRHRVPAHRHTPVTGRRPNWAVDQRPACTA